mmetsp:Transcript_47417/g.92525  ORF Transcript_47417/g.92525 Transcript_47417/m.92525 type:complete len:292 (-) Transcript_47417:179-1054(-)
MCAPRHQPLGLTKRFPVPPLLKRFPVPPDGGADVRRLSLPHRLHPVPTLLVVSAQQRKGDEPVAFHQRRLSPGPPCLKRRAVLFGHEELVTRHEALRGKDGLPVRLDPRAPSVHDLRQLRRGTRLEQQTVVELRRGRAAQHPERAHHGGQKGPDGRAAVRLLEGFPGAPFGEVSLLVPDREGHVVSRRRPVGFSARIVVPRPTVDAQRHPTHQVEIFEPLEFREATFAGGPPLLEFSLGAVADGEIVGGDVTIPSEGGGGDRSGKSGRRFLLEDYTEADGRSGVAPERSKS